MNYDIECLQDAFVEEVAETNPTCTLPWIESMMGIQGYNASDIPTCKNESFDEVKGLGYKFSTLAAYYHHPKCPGRKDNFASEY